MFNDKDSAVFKQQYICICYPSPLNNSGKSVLIRHNKQVTLL